MIKKMEKSDRVIIVSPPTSARAPLHHAELLNTDLPSMLRQLVGGKSVVEFKQGQSVNERPCRAGLDRVTGGPEKWSGRTGLQALRKLRPR
jgi:hypothetical protein